jgi:hypothetical protein
VGLHSLHQLSQHLVQLSRLADVSVLQLHLDVDTQPWDIRDRHGRTETHLELDGQGIFSLAGDTEDPAGLRARVDLHHTFAPAAPI